MYETYFGFQEKPFSIQPDPDLIYWGRIHSMAYAMLSYGIINRAGFTVITGEIGCGKTTLIRHLLNEIGDDTNVALLSNIVLREKSLLKWIMMAFEQPHERIGTVGLYGRFQKFLIDEYAAGRRTVLIVDEAQNLGAERLEELRMLSNINADKDQLLQIILVGQPGLRDILRDPDLAQITQRVASEFNLEPLAAEETIEYVAHRLTAVGGDRNVIDGAACRLVHEASGGIPRIINILCDISLVYAFASQQPNVTRETVLSVLRDKSRHGVFPVSWPAADEAAGDPSNDELPRPPEIADEEVDGSHDRKPPRLVDAAGDGDEDPHDDKSPLPLEAAE